MTRTKGSQATANEAHVLNFSLGNENDHCTLTVLVKDFRFNIVADARDLLKSTFDDPDFKGSSPQNLASPGQGTAQKRTPSPLPPSLKGTELEKDPKTALREWMLSPFSGVFDRLDPVPEIGGAKVYRQTLQEWYSGPTYFYKLIIGGDGKAAQQQLETSPELEEKIVKMAPRIKVPKAIYKLDIPWYEASEIEVVAAGDHYGLHAPTEVMICKKTSDNERENGGEGRKDLDTIYFFKQVDASQTASTKRELESLKDIEAKGLHHQINVPVVRGLVRWYGGSRGSSGNQIMGFLQTAIKNPTPLTRMLDSDVVEEKREEWANQAEEAVRVLHDAGIVWCDAKADNFMVDKDGKLWIIDFGGSYTEGWVDPDLVETEEGDDMGVDKIVGALRDPENMTYDPDASMINTSEATEDGEEAGNQVGKRRREASTEADSKKGCSPKKARL
ncbi:uncharacterized protein B0I36DRAFT_434955 [Microdochium trichocladiopsis]|uniref:Protein kinase domain-containing protein n=1 Tax=Microdochium trichocladiopsis TaxID=1682393 RepID=A0A9P8XVP8_9PEZI|nr:uncharacterized protein B0I36DRAFT_434955 [Microdochium trichocladiopsis]KAH7021035.1 hypothetical protein B0I36DRAFT_434955 [Microdochium trichocladiopsis]